MRWSAALVVLCAFVATACSVERTLDDARLEAEITDQLLPQYPDVIRSISCQQTEEPVPGDRLLCLASLEGGEVVDVNVEIGGVADELTATASIDARFVAVNEVAALLAATFGSEIGLATSVDCGRPVLVLAADEPVLCQATDPAGVTRNFDVFVDDDGVVSLQLR